jgi:pyruvate/2-oxoglutarate dehydrogenase complex dihydrolipoamide acyltransferase (E2) component
MVDIRLAADLWDDESPGVVASWLYSAGDTVSKGDVVAEVMNEKVSFEIEAPATGTLYIDVEAEAEVALGQAIGRIDG